MENFEELVKQEYSHDTEFSISAADSDTSGAVRYTHEIDKLADHPEVKAVRIFGLDQDTFEYFISRYGKQLHYIHFFRNRSVEDWSLLGTLPDLRCVNWYYNQKISKLWDMSGNYSLKALNISDFSKLHSIEGIEKAPALEWFEFGDTMWSTSEIDSLKPLENTGIRRINFPVKKIGDTDISFLKNMKKLEVFDFPANLFTTEEIARLVAEYPHLEGYALKPYITFMGYSEESRKADVPSVIITGKRKPAFPIEGNEKKLGKYVSQFNSLVEKYRS